MRTKEPRHNTEHKLRLDEELSQQLKQLGIVEHSGDLSRLCGKNTTYFACMRRRGYGLHLGSLTLLVARLGARLNGTEDVRERARLRGAIEAVNAHIAAKCRLREEELFA